MSSLSLPPFIHPEHNSWADYESAGRMYYQHACPTVESSNLREICLKVSKRVASHWRLAAGKTDNNGLRPGLRDKVATIVLSPCWLAAVLASQPAAAARLIRGKAPTSEAKASARRIPRSGLRSPHSSHNKQRLLRETCPWRENNCPLQVIRPRQYPCRRGN